MFSLWIFTGWGPRQWTGLAIQLAVFALAVWALTKLGDDHDDEA